MWSITGLEVDAANNRLWLSSSPTPAFHAYSETELGHGALFELDLETLDVIGQYFLPIDGLPHLLSGLTVASDGTVYVVDRTLPFLFRKIPGSKRLEPFFADPGMFSFVDIAADPASGRIYVSDIVRGVLVIDAAAQQVALLSGQDKMNLGGIKGIEYRDGSLYVVQGGFSPQRVVKLQLDPTGNLVESITPMAVAQEEFDGPALASIRDGKIYYFANSALQSDVGAIVMNTSLDAGVVVAPPDMSEFEDALRNMKK
jgi:DNA-binding beta-propeller fold protein YncE